MSEVEGYTVNYHQLDLKEKLLCLYIVTQQSI